MIAVDGLRYRREIQDRTGTPVLLSLSPLLELLVVGLPSRNARPTIIPRRALDTRRYRRGRPPRLFLRLLFARPRDDLDRPTSTAVCLG